MRRRLSAIILALALANAAAAQDAPRLQRAIDALPSPVTAEHLGALATDNPNAYVYYLQDFLAGRGLFSGTADGQLKRDTIRALLSYCGERGVEKVCSAGPLLPEAIAAVSKAVAGDTVPALPEGWAISDGRNGTLGLGVEIVSAASSSAVLHFRGKAARQGYVNVLFSPPQPSAPGTWVTSVTATSRQTGKDVGALWLRTAMQNDAGYQGELAEGQPLPQGDTPQRITLSGTPGDGVTQLLPYVQLWMREGDEVDIALTLADPGFERR